TSLDLAWDDALRSVALRDIVTFGLMVVVLTPLALLSHLSDGLEGGWPANAALGLVLGLVLVLLAAAVVTAVVAVLQQPQQWFRGRLWPGPKERTSGCSPSTRPPTSRRSSRSGPRSSPSSRTGASRPASACPRCVAS